MDFEETFIEEGDHKADENEGKFRPKISFLAKEPTFCPVCEDRFFRESLLSGGGRLNADIVTDLLHRLYKPSKEFGKIYPLSYSIVVCPSCFFACMPADFNKIHPEGVEELKKHGEERIDIANMLNDGPIDFGKFRTLESGAIAYVLSIFCYDFFSKKNVPVIKQAICSIRAAYLFEELNKEKPNKYYDFIAEMFYKKALFFYKQSIELDQKREQILENLKTLGPDMDKDYGYDGIIYIIGVLTYKFGFKENKEFRKKELEEAKLYLAKLFGMGKAKFNKPKEILEKSKDFYNLINDELKKLDEPL